MVCKSLPLNSADHVYQERDKDKVALLRPVVALPPKSLRTSPQPLPLLDDAAYPPLYASSAYPNVAAPRFSAKTHRLCNVGTTNSGGTTAKRSIPQMSVPLDVHKFFPSRLGNGDCINDIVSSRLQIDEVGKYSITLPDDAAEIADTLCRFEETTSADQGRGTLVAMDATAGVGGDTLALASRFPKVIAVERDVHAYRMLVNNLCVYGLGEGDDDARVTTVCADYAMAMHWLPPVDVLYMDPPWNPPGRPWHTSLKSVMLYLGTTPVYKVVWDAMARQPHLRIVALKCPYNFDVRTFIERLPDVPVIQRRIKSFVLLVMLNPCAVSASHLERVRASMRPGEKFLRP